MYGYVYKFTLIPTNKIYIGQKKATKFVESYYGSGKVWKHLVDSYGKENIKREILEWCNTKEELNKREIELISQYNSTNPEIGYNISKGGGVPSGWHHSEESKKRIGLSNSVVQKGRHRSKEEIDAVKRGCNTPEAKKHLSDAAKKRCEDPAYRYKLGHWRGKTNDVKSGKSVRCIETGEVFISAAHAERWVSGSTKKGRGAGSKIREICSGSNKYRHTYKGYHWEYC